MIEFNISQMAALILDENVKISYLLESQIKSAPSKADIWRLRCEKDELVDLNKKLAVALENNTQLNSGVKSLVIDEFAQICKKYT